MMTSTINISSNKLKIGLVVLVVLLVSLLLAWISPAFSFFSFLSVSFVAVAFIIIGWWLLRKESIPNWVGTLIIGAIVLRLLMGAAWYILLPIWGHGSEVEKAGYIMSDAYHRDQAAWELADSNTSLVAAFQGYRQVDQYGGLLFFSAAIYRIFGGDIHQPLMMIILTAVFSASMILYSWASTNRLWGPSVAKVTVWIIALYPEAVLLGSSQMREAFTMTLMSIAVFGLIYYYQEHSWWGIGWILLALALSIPLSTLFSVMLLIILSLLAIVLFRVKIFRNWILWATLGGLLLIGIGAVWIFGERIYPEGSSNPLTLIREWLVFSGRWEIRSIALSSGWFNKILNRSPEWMHLWLIIGYGTFQPFLPAALIATGNWLWRAIAIWRSIGWTLLFVLLIYAPFRSFEKKKSNFIPAGMTLFAWLGILLAAFRGGGDQWDNPRYRVVFLVFQASLASWVWIKQRDENNPGFHRIIVSLGFVFAWFVPWYLRRYIDSFTWPIVDLFKTVGLGFITAILYWLYDWVRVEGVSENVD